MSTVSLSFNLLESNSDISSKILKALAPDIEKHLNTMLDKLVDSIPNILVSFIVAQPEYDSLMGGTLQYEFGIPDPAPRLSEILDTIKNGSVVTRKPFTIKSNGITGGFKIQMVQKDFADLLGLGAASINTEKGDTLNWLQWLLLDGDNVIISDNIFIFGPNQHSRTGLGIMRPSMGGFWRVPPEYAGTINNNWITRAINSAGPSIEKEIQQLIN